MQAFKKFQREDQSFWFFIRFISERLGYTDRKYGVVKAYTKDEIEELCANEGVEVSPDQLVKAVDYCKMRAELLNKKVSRELMDVDQAKSIFEQLRTTGRFHSKLIMNKQKAEKKNINYLAAIVTMLAERTLGGTDEFDPDPHGLIYLLNNRKIIGSSSRRFDGAYPSIYNPKIVWEIKEYYYTTTFGSRIADAVYESELDGYEFNEIYNRTGQHVYHVVFIDSYFTFWGKGKSYLCRFIDTLNMGLIDELIIGREVITRWPQVLNEVVLKASDSF